MTESASAPHEPGPEPASADVAAGHELSDVSVRGLIVFLIGLVVSLAVVVFAIAWMFSLLGRRADQRDPPPPPLAELRPQQPPEPRLQQSPAIDMQKMREFEEAALKKTQWIDKQQGVIQIPIDRAMQSIAERGLPHWPPPKETNQKHPDGAAGARSEPDRSASERTRSERSRANESAKPPAPPGD